jgi:Clostripain family
VLWGHAYQFAIGHDETRTGIEALDFGELAGVLQKFQASAHGRRAAGSNAFPEKIDVIGFDACDVATIEIAHQLEPFASYLVASQIGIPLPGWPYKTILGRLKESADTALMEPDQFGTFAVRKFCEEYAEELEGAPVPVSLTLLDLGKAKEAFEATELLARALALAGGTDATEFAMVQEQFFRSQTLAGKPFVDVADLCLNLSRYSRNDAVQEAAAQLGNLLIRPRAEEIVRASSNGRARLPRGSFIVEHARNSHLTAKLQGVSLYAPQVASDQQDWRSTRFWYNKFVSPRETFWSRLVHVLAEGT